MKKIAILTQLILTFIGFPLYAQNTEVDIIKTEKGIVTVHPIHHATMAITYGGKTIYVDPTGGAAAFSDLKKPDLILITDIHPDHFSIETLRALDTKSTLFVVPKAVAKQMPEMFKNQLVILANGETTTKMGIPIHAVAMYNLPKSPDAYHVKGRGNGYVLTLGGKKFYIAGDTEDIPEMRSLEDIYVAFIPMNLPYTMSVEQAADAVLEFEPAIVYPYHYGESDIQKFKRLVNKGNAEIDVRLRDWYPNSK